MKAKFTALVFAAVLVTGFAAAQGQAPDSAPTDKGPSQGAIPDLPAQASNVAKQVTDTINDFLSGDIKNLGNALQELLGNGQAANLTEE